MKANRIGRCKYHFIIIFFLIYILIILNAHQNYEFNSKNIKQIIYPEMITYKGKKILKSKLINDYLLKLSDDNISERDDEIEKINFYYNLAHYSNEKMIKSELKAKFFEEISKLKNQTIKKIDIFYLSYCLNFGNNLIAINNAIFYCEIVGCHKIILNKYQKRKWFIIKPVININSNITILQGSNVNCTMNNVLCFYEVSWPVYFPRVMKPEVRTYIIKEEILKNLPDVNIKPDELFIHIRSGDIFKYSIGRTIAQPPLCFYEKILNKYKIFKNIYIISMDNGNIIVDALLNKYKNILYKKNSLEYDISLLSHSYNLVLSVSTFAHSSIKLNDNLKNIWEFDMIRLSEKFFFLHHHIYKFKVQYKIYTMKPSDFYLKKMLKWTRSPEQIKLMLEEQCPFDFLITKPNI